MLQIFIAIVHPLAASTLYQTRFDRRKAAK